MTKWYKQAKKVVMHTYLTYHTLNQNAMVTLQLLKYIKSEEEQEEEDDILY